MLIRTTDFRHRKAQHSHPLLSHMESGAREAALACLWQQKGYAYKDTEMGGRRLLVKQTDVGQ